MAVVHELDRVDRGSGFPVPQYALGLRRPGVPVPLPNGLTIAAVGIKDPGPDLLRSRVPAHPLHDLLRITSRSGHVVLRHKILLIERPMTFEIDGRVLTFGRPLADHPGE